MSVVTAQAYQEPLMSVFQIILHNLLDLSLSAFTGYCKLDIFRNDNWIPQFIPFDSNQYNSLNIKGIWILETTVLQPPP